MKINDYIEHTKLNPDLTDRDIDELVAEAIRYQFVGICVPPFWVKRAKRDLEGYYSKLVTVVGFPLGYQMTESKLSECEQAIDNGADEIDIVLNVSAFKSGMTWPKIELVKCAKLLHESEIIMKVILETSLLDKEQIAQASTMAADAGADFVKTSTGFSSAGAKTEDILTMKNAIPSTVGIKASGGIKSYEDCLQMIDAGATRIGTSSGVKIYEEWLSTENERH